MRVPVRKVQGAGNDFVVVDLRPGQPAASAADRVMSPETVKAICDRHFGIGGDGVLAILEGDKGDARMRVLNADGSEAEMCGNGIRCVARVLYESDQKLRRPRLLIDTGAGLLECAMDATSGQGSVTVDMGKPRLGRGEIPMKGPENESVVRVPFTSDDREFSLTAVSMGNPHAVFFIDDPTEDLLDLARTYGPDIEVDGNFPRRTNVEFARVRHRASAKDRLEIDLVVWERGVGITMACGTGACATAVAAYLEGRGPGDEEVAVHVPGGTLFIRVNAGQHGPEQTASLSPRGVQMRGPAHIVFETEIDLDALPTARK